MAIMTLTVGRLSIFGLHRATMLVPIFLTWTILSPMPWLPASLVAEVQAKLMASNLSLTDVIAQAQAGSGTSSATTAKVATALVDMRMDSTYLVWVALFFFVGAIIPVLVLPLVTRKMQMPKPTPHPRSEAVPYTVIITLLTAGAVYFFLEHPKLVAGSFLIATILVLTQVGNEIEWKITIERVLGTFGGVLLLMAITNIVGGASYVSVLDIPMPMTYYAIGIVFGAVAIIAKFSPRQWIYYILVTPTAALLNAFTTGQATRFGDQRLVDNLVGAVLVVAATVVTLVAGRIMKGRMTIAPALGGPDASPA
ncbi:MAG: hypothetical protein FGM58_05955 [Acidimicrobiia bacterium]|nr:hypothetical protein [Acidimicrobiia bacterium]